MSYIYADNAATTKLDIEAFDAMKPYLLDEYANASQPYSFSRTTKKALKEARKTIAECIGALPEEIFFTSGGTESDNWAVKGVAFDSSTRDGIITSSFEHHAVLNACKSVEHNNCPVIYIEPNTNGIVTCDALEKAITNNTKLVSIMYANNELGTIQSIKELCEIAHKNGALFHTDAVQAVGHVPINVSEIGVDFLSASAHKFNGPKGIGFLYIKKGTNIIPFNDGGAQENGKRAGTENVASIVGMAVALKNNCDNIEKNIDYIKRIEERLIAKLDKTDILYKINGSGNKLPGLISLSIKNADGEAILHRLDLHGICISTGSACDSIHTEVSHVLNAISLNDSYAKGTIRISFGKYNAVDDADKIVLAIKDIFCR